MKYPKEFEEWWSTQKGANLSPRAAHNEALIKKAVYMGWCARGEVERNKWDDDRMYEYDLMPEEVEAIIVDIESRGV
jgi:hypothetical protein